VLLSRPLAARCRSATMDVGARRLVKPSDHVPVVVELDDEQAASGNSTELAR